MCTQLKTNNNITIEILIYFFIILKVIKLANIQLYVSGRKSIAFLRIVQIFDTFFSNNYFLIGGKWGLGFVGGKKTTLL